MSKPLFSIITPAKNENNYEDNLDLLNNWNYAIKGFEHKYNLKNSVEIIIVDGGGNSDFYEMIGEINPVFGYKVIPYEVYEPNRLNLFYNGIIKQRDWDTPGFARNLGYELGNPEADIIIFQDFDTRVSAGDKTDLKYITEKDFYKNFFEINYEAFLNKNIVAATPSLRAYDSKEVKRRFAIKVLNLNARISTKIKSISIQDRVLAGPSIPGPSVVFRKGVVDKEVERMREKYEKQGRISGEDDVVGLGPYHPELAIAEDYELSRRVGMHGRVSYEKDAGVFIRTLKRVKEGHVILRSLRYLFLWIPHYFYPEYFKYKKHTLSV